MTRSLADAFSRAGLSVLAVDADPQGNLSDYYDADPDAQPTLGEVLVGQARAVDAVHGEVIPANLGLAEAELVLAGKIGREMTLRNALRDVKRHHDVVLIDCPPTLGLLTVNALVAATHAVLSTEPKYFSLQGVEQAMEVFQLARESLNPELELLGVVLNIANMRTRHARHTLEALRERFGDAVCESVIRESIVYAESAERARADPRLPPQARGRLPRPRGGAARAGRMGGAGRGAARAARGDRPAAGRDGDPGGRGRDDTQEVR